MDSQNMDPSVRAPSPILSERTQSQLNSTANLVPSTTKSEGPRGKGRNFWLSFAAVAASILLAAMDLTAVSTILPTITRELNGGSNYVWIGSAYALASTATLPLSGAFADTFGRRPTMLSAIALFTLGSALAGAAQNMAMIIAARTIQGLGGGAIQSLCQIILSDLVPLAERGTYHGLLALTYSFASGIGPPIGGALSEHASWRWVFYLNLPVCGFSFTLVFFFLNVRTPEGTISSKLAKIDWLGNLIVIVGTTLAIIGLSWGGIRFSWSSAQVLAPLILGLVTIAVFIAYEAIVPQQPTIPWAVVSHRTSFSAYLGTFSHGIAIISIVYYVPVYFQACLLASPIHSGVDLLGIALIMAPFSLVAGITVQAIQKYRPVIGVGWVFFIVGLGTMSLLKITTSTATWVGFQIIASIGAGLLWAAIMFAVLAPQPANRTASALAFFNFVRSFAMTWGITIAGSILQNQLKSKLPPDFVNTFPAGVEIAFAAIPVIPTLPEPLRTQVRVAFADSLSLVWKVMAGVGCAGLISSLALQEIRMTKVTDENYGLQEAKVEPEKVELEFTGSNA